MPLRQPRRDAETGALKGQTLCLVHHPDFAEQRRSQQHAIAAAWLKTLTHYDVEFLLTFRIEDDFPECLDDFQNWLTFHEARMSWWENRAGRFLELCASFDDFADCLERS